MDRIGSAPELADRRRPADHAEPEFGHVIDRIRGEELLDPQPFPLVDDVTVEGQQLVDRFVEAKSIEWEQYRSHVSAWEVNRYLGLH